jgi:hypothetical protein
MDKNRDTRVKMFCLCGENFDHIYSMENVYICRNCGNLLLVENEIEMLDDCIISVTAHLFEKSSKKMLKLNYFYQL